MTAASSRARWERIGASVSRGRDVCRSALLVPHDGPAEQEQAHPGADEDDHRQREEPYVAALSHFVPQRQPDRGE